MTRLTVEEVAESTGRRALKKGVRRTVLDRDEHQCRKCGHGPDGLEIHHVLAVADGGGDEIGNLVALCGPCHAEWTFFLEGVEDFDVWLSFPVRATVLMRTLWCLPHGTTLGEVWAGLEKLGRGIARGGGA